MYWRRFALSDIPLDDTEAFEVWLRERWIEKDALLEEYVSTGRFPAAKDLEFETKKSNDGSVITSHKGGFIETEMKPAHWFEVFRVFMVLVGFGITANLLARFWNLVRCGSSGCIP
jgi:hypothetical protein